MADRDADWLSPSSSLSYWDYLREDASKWRRWATLGRAATPTPLPPRAIPAGNDVSLTLLNESEIEEEHGVRTTAISDIKIDPMTAPPVCLRAVTSTVCGCAGRTVPPNSLLVAPLHSPLHLCYPPPLRRTPCEYSESAMTARSRSS